MNCLDGAVGLRDIEDGIYFVNDCLGISGELMEYLQDDDTANLSDFWQVVKTRGYNKFYNKFVLSFHDLYKSCCQKRTDLDFYLQSIFCSNKSIFYFSWLNCLCLEICLERKHSSNVNPYTTTKTQNLNELISFYEKEYDLYFQNSMQSLVIPENVSVEKTGGCIVTTKFIVP